MAEIAREDGEIPVRRSRCNDDVGETGQAAGCALPVHEQSCLSRCDGAEGNYPCAAEMEDQREPVVEACSPGGGSGPSEPGKGRVADRLEFRLLSGPRGLPAPSGMRQRLLHDCFDIDLRLVWDTVASDLSALIVRLEPLVPPGGVEGKARESRR